MSKNYRAELYEDALGEWRWRLVASNGNTVATSGEGYKNKSEARERLIDVTTNGVPLIEELE